jgi:hypothetical protein
MPDNGTIVVTRNSLGQWEDKEENIYPDSAVRVSAADPSLGIIGSSGGTTQTSTTSKSPAQTQATSPTGIVNTGNLAGDVVPGGGYWDKRLGFLNQFAQGKLPDTSNMRGEYYTKAGTLTGGQIQGADGNYYYGVWDGKGGVVPGELVQQQATPQGTSSQPNQLSMPDEPTYRITPEGLILVQTATGWQYGGQLNQGQNPASAQAEIDAYNATTGKQQIADRKLQQQQLEMQKAESDMAAKLELAKLQGQPVDWIKAWYADQAMKPKSSQPYFENPGEMPLVTSTQNALQSSMGQLDQYIDKYGITPTELGGQSLNFPDPSRQGVVDQAKELSRIVGVVGDDANKALGTTIGNTNVALNTDVNNLQPGATGLWAEYLGSQTQGKRKPQAPQAPEWLAQYAPNVANKYGEITKVEAPTLSGQQFAAADPTKLQGLQGYLNWASTFNRGDGTLGGQSWEDMVARMKRMQPGTPSGAGTERWAATRQRSV